MKKLFVVFLSFFLVNAQIDYEDLINTGQLNNFDQCTVLRTVNDVGLGIKQAQVLLFWKFSGAANDTFDAAMVAKIKNDGYLGFGPNQILDREVTYRMLKTDAVIGFNKAGASNVDDYFILGTKPDYGAMNVCGGGKGVCLDTSQGGTKTASGTYAFNATDLIAQLIWSRPVAATDAGLDVAIQNQEQMFCFAFSDKGGIIGGDINYHTNRDVIYANLFAPAVCPKGANGLECSGASNGDCVKGCCVCKGNFTNFDCGADKNNLGGNQAGGIADTIVEADYPFSFTPLPQVKYFWKIDEAAGTIDIAMRCQGCGWLAIGIGDDELMPFTDAYLGYVDETKNPPQVILEDFKIGPDRNNICPGLCPDTDPTVGGTRDLLAFNGHQTGDTTELLFRRKLVTGDAKGDFDIPNAEINALWAFGLVDGPSFDTHAIQNRGPVKINFFEGGVVIKDVEPLRKAHGALMFIIWAVAIPFTSFLARYWKRFPWWFNVHRIVNAIAMLAGLAAFVLAIFIVGSHFDTGHKIIGLIVTIIGTVQPFIGILADCLFDPSRTSTPWVPDRLHWILGWGSILLGLINIALGLFAYQVTIALIHIIYLVFAGLLVAFLATFFVVNLITGFPGGGH